MINPQELRLGNLVYGENGLSCKIRKYDFDHTNFNKLYPITLTPNILDKLGFTPNAIGTLAIELWDISTHLEIIPAGFVFYVSIDQMQDIGAPQNVSLQCISYVHELQNLIYFLTKKELQIDSII